MSNIFEDDITLPGVITHVEADYSFGYDTSLFGTTDSEIIIGTAFNGPVGVLTPVYSVEHAIYMFGQPYDSKKRQEVTLVAGIQDAWDRGCRTIYACRIGGIDMYKDFNLKVDSKYKLRLSSMFPTNIGKECYMRYDDRAGLEEISFYKPIERATIAEKKRGVATGNKTVIKNTIKIALDNGLSRDDRLVDLVNAFNNHAFNNVLKLMIVDKDGNDVTNTPEAYELSIGAMYPGVYFIGRSSTNAKANVMTRTKFVYIANDDMKPYKSFDEKYYRKLVKNTDVTLPYPIYDNKMSDLRKDLREAGVLMVDDWDFLETADLTDRVFTKDDVDYEETSMTPFDIYQRLGMGYAITAHAIRRTDSEGKELRPRIKESEADDSNHVVAITDGIYSVIQDSNAKYRVLTCANADESINGKLPRAKSFHVAAANDAIILGGDIRVKANVAPTDLKAARKFDIKFEKISDSEILTDKMDKVDTDDIRKIIAELPSDPNVEDYDNGTLLSIGGKLKRVGDTTIDDVSGTVADGTKYIVVDATGDAKLMKADATGALIADTLSTGKEYALGDDLSTVFAYKEESGTLVPQGEFSKLTSEDASDVLTVAATDLGGVLNHVIIRSNVYDTSTVDEVAEDLNANDVFSRLFIASLTDDGSLEKDDFVEEAEHAKKAFGAAAVTDPTTSAVITPAVPAEVVSIEDRQLTYDYSRYIPYRTSDNFVRQLAQHCTYTEIKTAPTHGVIGVKTLSNLGLASVAKKVSSIIDRDFDLYAKTSVGHNMLDSNSMPYPIGKNVSLVFGQYPITVGSTSYQYISNGAAGYAAMVSTLPLDQSSTGQTISIPTPSYSLTNTQLGQLTSYGAVTFKNSFTKGIVVTDGITMAPAESIYRRLSTSRIVGAVEELIRAAAEPFIGKENHQANRNALNTAIKSELDKIVGKLIEKYDFTMNTDPSLMKFNRIEIDYQIIPIYEIREVSNSIKMVDTITANA